MADPRITDLESRLASVERELADARLAVQARDDFLAIAAHELRTPMNSLGLQLATLERLVRADPPDMPALAGRVSRARRAVADFVDRAGLLLDATRLSAGHVETFIETVDLNACIERVVERFADEAAFHRIELVVDTGAPVTGRWDRQAIDEILSNLVSNAIKYGGARVEIAARREGSALACLSVSDAGPGIAESDRQRIFAKFERLVVSEPLRSGFGLGLWIVGRLVDALHGTIRIGGGETSGAVFDICLPIAGPTAGLEDEHHG